MGQIEKINFIENEQTKLTPCYFVRNFIILDKYPDRERLNELLNELEYFLDYMIDHAGQFPFTGHEAAFKNIQNSIGEMYRVREVYSGSALRLCRIKSRLAIVLTAFEPYPIVDIEHMMESQIRSA